MIMLQGTASNVGKSALATALCRIFKQDGLRVAPFKSWNMALNSYVTPCGGEIGRAQGEQALACGIEPSVDMNPVLVKPKGEGESQVIIRGKPWKDRRVGEGEKEYRKVCLEAISQSLQNLKEQFDCLVIEGAGSPAEINLRQGDMANMRIALMADAPVLLVTDVDRGGALASAVGTMILLTPRERDQVAGFIFNKFRGDLSILKPGLSIVEERTGKPVIGVVPHMRGLNLAAEDGVVLEERNKERGGPRGDKGKIDLAVINLPRISNFTDFDTLGEEPGVCLRFVDRPEDLGSPDAIIIPGSKNSVSDLIHLHEKGMVHSIKRAAQRGIPLIGICGGYQMLGRELRDPLKTESSHGSLTGLGLLDTVTSFYPEKQTCQVEAKVEGLSQLLPSLEKEVLQGYEIHMGQTELLEGARPAFCIQKRSGREIFTPDGAVGKKGFVFGTYLHGIFDNYSFRKGFLKYLFEKKGLNLPEGEEITCRKRLDKTYDFLAQVVRENLDMDYIYDLVGATSKVQGK
ncbi:MAG: cobyric acid synthase [Candidatus Syntrophonatronum acetioxidans]|uniref:Cobyric acid synthase n=1 Tax=Candidatus Syntrophonatronum acetioxidans TaxID=1795816 RepID=A0A424YFM7_9FIRM|nr:MAG: cobyric acid synthase [Candidatus Syntrophonatronum acetioxidans]